MILRMVFSMEKPPSLFLMLLLSELHQLPVLLFSCLISSCFYMAAFILSFLLCLSCLSISFSVFFFFSSSPFSGPFSSSQWESLFISSQTATRRTVSSQNKLLISGNSKNGIFFFTSKRLWPQVVTEACRDPNVAGQRLSICWLAPKRETRENKPQGF